MAVAERGVSDTELPLVVLDQSPVRSGGTVEEAVADTIALARATERFGYRRYWLAEHHGASGFAGCAPEILIGHVASATSAIRVGSGGVMLSHYSPYKVAETFRLLETLHPGRIDLGLGRAPGSDGITAAALAYGSPTVDLQYFPTKVVDLMAFLTGERPATEPLTGLSVTPDPGRIPELWLLGSSGDSALLAARIGLAFAFAHFINPVDGPAVAQAYRERFEAGERQAAPRVSVAAFVICADSEAEALRLAKSRDLWRLEVDRGRLAPFPSVEEAEAYRYTPAEQARVEVNRQRNVVGAPEQVRASLERLVREHQADELVVLTITHDFAARVRSYELVAEAFELPRAA